MQVLLPTYCNSSNQMVKGVKIEPGRTQAFVTQAVQQLRAVATPGGHSCQKVNVPT